jgi:hypothetical protein
VQYVTWPDVDFVHRVIRVKAKPKMGFIPKDWEEREVLMSDQLYRSLRVHKAKAPVSGAKALMDYDCFFSAEMNGAHEDFVLGVRVPIIPLSVQQSNQRLRRPQSTSVPL